MKLLKTMGYNLLEVSEQGNSVYKLNLKKKITHHSVFFY